MKSEDDEFASFFDESYPGLCRFLECLLGGGRAAAEDVAQESFMRLYHKAWRTLPAGEARFWLFRVARNLALNELGRRQTRHRLFEKVVAAFTAHAPDPEREYEAAEQRGLVLELLGRLPEPQRAALLLREQEEMSYREIADVLGVSEAKVKVDIFRARGAMRDHWGRKQKTVGSGQ